MKIAGKVADMLNNACGTLFPGAVCSVFYRGEELFSHAAGRLGYDPHFNHPTDEETIYDIASLTKPFATVTIVMSLVAEGKLSLEWTLDRFFDEKNPLFRGIRIYHLLTHSSGLPPWRGYGAELLAEAGLDKAGTEEIRQKILYRIFEEELLYLTGSKSEYSDLGFILLGEIVEKCGGDDIRMLFKKFVSSPVGLKSTFFTQSNCKPEKALLDRIAPTEFCSLRSRLVHGEVHDDNAYALGGAAGHAGLFSTAREIAIWANELLKAYLGKDSIFSHIKDFIRLFWSKRYSPRGSTWRLGFDSKSAFGSSAGRFFSRLSVGHLGFTGCSVWIDPQAELVVTLLTNRVHPTRENNEIKRFRPRFHDEVWWRLKNNGDLNYIL